MPRENTAIQIHMILTRVDRVPRVAFRPHLAGPERQSAPLRPEWQASSRATPMLLDAQRERDLPMAPVCGRHESRCTTRAISREESSA